MTLGSKMDLLQCILLSSGMASSSGRQALAVGVGVAAGTLLLAKLFGGQRREGHAPIVGARFVNGFYGTNELRDMAIIAAADRLRGHTEETSWVFLGIAATKDGQYGDSVIRPIATRTQAWEFAQRAGTQLPPNAFVGYWAFLHMSPDGMGIQIVDDGVGLPK